jgi:hypothetical protein
MYPKWGALARAKVPPASVGGVRLARGRRVNPHRHGRALTPRATRSLHHTGTWVIAGHSVRLKQMERQVREALRRHLRLTQFEALRGCVMPLAEARGFLTDEDVFGQVS